MPVTTVKLLCHCGGVLDQFKVPEQPPADAWEFVFHGRTRPGMRGGRYASDSDAPDLQLPDMTPSRAHVDKGFVRAPGDPEPDYDIADEDDFAVADALLPTSIVRYRCHPRRCGQVWRFWVRELADASYQAGPAGRREIRASDLDHRGAATAYWQGVDERAPEALKRLRIRLEELRRKAEAVPGRDGAA